MPSQTQAMITGMARKRDQRWLKARKRFAELHRHTTVWDHGSFDSTLTSDRDAFAKNPSLPEWAIPSNYYAVLP